MFSFPSQAPVKCIPAQEKKHWQYKHSTWYVWYLTLTIFGQQDNNLYVPMLCLF